MDTKPNRSIDEKSIELARHFLSDVKGATEEDQQELAEAIQQLCEDFCGDIARDEYEKKSR